MHPLTHVMSGSGSNGSSLGLGGRPDEEDDEWNPDLDMAGNKSGNKNNSNNRRKGKVVPETHLTNEEKRRITLEKNRQAGKIKRTLILESFAMSQEAKVFDSGS